MKSDKQRLLIAAQELVTRGDPELCSCPMLASLKIDSPGQELRAAYKYFYGFSDFEPALFKEIDGYHMDFILVRSLALLLYRETL